MSTKSSGNVASSSSLIETPISSVEIDKETSLFLSSLEIERIISAFRLNPYDILDLPFSTPSSAINKIYRKKSLLIHPDKVDHPQAVVAFDLLKRASDQLADEAKRAIIDGQVQDARTVVLYDLGFAPNTQDDSPEVLALDPPMNDRIKKALVTTELARRNKIKTVLANEGATARKLEEEIESRKRKLEEKKVWEENRDGRVQNWQKFAKSGSGKKKKSKPEVLG